MKNDKTYQLLSQEIYEAKKRYEEEGSDSGFKELTAALNNRTSYLTHSRSSRLSEILLRKEESLYDSLAIYQDDPNVENYNDLVNLTKSVAHILLLKKALVGGVGSAMALQTLGEKYPLGIGRVGKLTRKIIKEILLSAPDLPPDQIEGLISRLGVLNEGLGELSLKSIRDAYTRGDITIKEMNQMLAALRQEKELLLDGEDDMGNLGYIEKDFYDQLK